MISLRAENLSKKFNRNFIFKDLSFEHSEGILGISGANGSGKSTLIKCLAFLLRPNSGSFEWIRDEKVLEQNEMKSLTGFAAPYINLYSELSVIENLVFLIELSGVKANDNHLKELLMEFQLLELEHQLFGSLSTGQQQRTKLAAALIRNPEILFLDEPGSNLDEKGHELVTSVVRKAASTGKMVIIASNDPNEIGLCDQVIDL